MDPDVAATRAAYDTVAEDYLALVRDAVDDTHPGDPRASIRTGDQIRREAA